MANEHIEKLPQIAVDYIDSVIKHVRYRKTIRNEVRQELEAHFADALHGCESEDERQKRAQALIAGFGEVKLLARLIRRGKKRCRPLWRTLVVRAFQLVGVLFLLLVLYIGWFFSGKPIITTNYLEVLNTHVRPVADDSLNARPLYEQAINAYVPPQHIQTADGQPEEFDTSPRKYSSLTPEERQVLKQWLAANQESIDLIEQGNEKPYYWREYRSNGNAAEIVTVLVPDLKELRRLAFLICWNGVEAAHVGDFDRAFDSVLECYSFGKHLRTKAILIEQLMAIAIESLSTDTLRQMLRDHASMIEAGQLAQTRARLEQMLGKPDFAVGLEGERLFAYDEIQRSFTQTRIGRSHIYIQRLGQLMPMLGNSGENEWLGKWFTLLFTHPDRDETLKSVDDFYAQMQQWSQYSPAQLRSRQIDIDRQTAELAERNLFLSLLFPAMEKVIQLSYRNRADSEATLTVLAILQYRKEHDNLPDSLAALVDSGLLKDVPIDPFSDKPLVYRRLDDTFTLYSVGLNFEDDAGVPAKDDDGHVKNWADKGDTIFWPPNAN